MRTPVTFPFTRTPVTDEARFVRVRARQLDIPADGVVDPEEQGRAREEERANEERRGAALASILEPAARERRA